MKRILVLGVAAAVLVAAQAPVAAEQIQLHWSMGGFGQALGIDDPRNKPIGNATTSVKKWMCYVTSHRCNLNPAPAGTAENSPCTCPAFSVRFIGTAHWVPLGTAEQ